jgi:hypothetical protein
VVARVRSQVQPQALPEVQTPVCSRRQLSGFRWEGVVPGVPSPIPTARRSDDHTMIAPRHRGTVRSIRFLARGSAFLTGITCGPRLQGTVRLQTACRAPRSLRQSNQFRRRWLPLRFCIRIEFHFGFRSGFARRRRGQAKHAISRRALRQAFSGSLPQQAGIGFRQQTDVKLASSEYGLLQVPSRGNVDCLPWAFVDADNS